jgi:hypothetical protein
MSVLQSVINIILPLEQVIDVEILAVRSKMSKPVQTFHMDSRLPVSPNVDEKDPNHPKNITKSNLMVQNQSSADTKYDIYPPPRVEGFSSMPNDKKMLWAVFISALLTAFVSISFLTYTQNIIFRILFIIATVLSINYGIMSLEKLTV